MLIIETKFNFMCSIFKGGILSSQDVGSVTATCKAFGYLKSSCSQFKTVSNFIQRKPCALLTLKWAFHFIPKFVSNTDDVKNS